MQVAYFILCWKNLFASTPRALVPFLTAASCLASGSRVSHRAPWCEWHLVAGACRAPHVPTRPARGISCSASSRQRPTREAGRTETTCSWSRAPADDAGDAGWVSALHCSTTAQPVTRTASGVTPLPSTAKETDPEGEAATRGPEPRAWPRCPAGRGGGGSSASGAATCQWVPRWDRDRAGPGRGSLLLSLPVLASSRPRVSWGSPGVCV